MMVMAMAVTVQMIAAVDVARDDLHKEDDCTSPGEVIASLTS